MNVSGCDSGVLDSVEESRGGLKGGWWFYSQATLQSKYLATIIVDDPTRERLVMLALVGQRKVERRHVSSPAEPWPRENNTRVRVARSHLEWAGARHTNPSNPTRSKLTNLNEPLFFALVNISSSLVESAVPRSAVVLGTLISDTCYCKGFTQNDGCDEKWLAGRVTSTSSKLGPSHSPTRKEQIRGREAAEKQQRREECGTGFLLSAFLQADILLGRQIGGCNRGRWHLLLNPKTNLSNSQRHCQIGMERQNTLLTGIRASGVAIALVVVPAILDVTCRSAAAQCRAHQAHAWGCRQRETPRSRRP
ncbi:hypothetical protein B0J13DRAFT_613567 [Dactylonectria estremocensis]|uniref:Uncharacterized protein n=1 Tax=Dactylonectria estremocensis TaxID=1079267 RepID=A0A9P9D926_9HYPO|nr:hypothetical protein B0J13DRAFT_613567 [Dactylonectria estremocensis]